MNLVVTAKDLRKRYGEFVAVDGIDLSVEAGECFGLLGPNGAGKTSTLRMIQAISAPSSGELRVLGLDPVSQGKSVRARLGVCPQEDNLDPDLSVFDNLVTYGRYYGLSAKERGERAEALLEFVSLTERRDARIQALSGGMKRRLTLARALVHSPELLVLDEPTTGLDPQARHLLWQKLRELQGAGVTLLLTTHYMDEAERLCNRIVIMDQGHVLDEGSPRELIHRHVGDEVLELHCAPEEEKGICEGISLTGLRTERSGTVRYFFFEEESRPVAEALRVRSDASHFPCLLRRATLEDVFLGLTGRELIE